MHHIAFHLICCVGIRNRIAAEFGGRVSGSHELKAGPFTLWRFRLYNERMICILRARCRENARPFAHPAHAGQIHARARLSSQRSAAAAVVGGCKLVSIPGRIRGRDGNVQPHRAGLCRLSAHQRRPHVPRRHAPQAEVRPPRLDAIIEA